MSDEQEVQTGGDKANITTTGKNKGGSKKCINTKSNGINDQSRGQDWRKNHQTTHAINILPEKSLMLVQSLDSEWNR